MVWQSTNVSKDVLAAHGIIFLNFFTVVGWFVVSPELKEYKDLLLK